MCDVTWGLCDINCCCDPDCTPATVSAFEFCLPEMNSAPSIRYCYPKTSATDIKRINNQNDIYIDKKTQGLNAICVVRANHPSDLYKYFSVPTSVSKPVGSSFVWNYSEGNAGFQIGEPMSLLKRTASTSTDFRNAGTFQIPSSDSRGDCRFPGQSVTFLSPVEGVSCMFLASRLCEAMPISYFTNLYLYNPGGNATAGTETTPITLHIYDQNNNLVMTLDPSVVPANSTYSTVLDTDLCTNAITKVTTVFEYNSTLDNKVVAASVSVYIKDVPISSFVPLTYQSFFRMSNQTIPENIISATPGYLPGLKIRAGTLETNSTTGSQAISERMSGFAIPSGGRDCSLENYRKVGFMYSVIASGCYKNFSESELINLCSSGSYDTIISVLSTSSIINVVGQTSDALANDTSMWISISGLSATVANSSTYNTIERKCENMVVGIKYEFVVARAGLEYNAQDIIVGAFASPILGTWQITNTSDFTSSAISRQKLKFEVEFSRYDPYSQATVRRRVKAPPILPRLDNTIFYPFRKPYKL
ncbi:Tectonic-1 [Strigomonas culicis]|nr:Tectonic-1 [Strigomonas culicis]|eukprot:EPY29551.1 Tectonic-1 [Strigomonas culicis]